MVGMRRTSGLTLIEVVFTVGIVATTLASLALFFVTLCAMNESSRSKTRAVTHAQVVLEQVRNICYGGGLVAVTGTNWTTWWNNWAAANGPSLIEPGEQVTVHYVANPPPDALPAPPPAGPPNPLTVTVRVRWTERGGAVRRSFINTLLTQR